MISRQCVGPPAAFIGDVVLDPVGEILGTGYCRFQSAVGIDGLAKWTPDRLDLLAVTTRTPGRGRFRVFISLAKQYYKTICVWVDINPIVGEALERYGFRRVTEKQFDGEIVEGWRWDKPEEEKSLTGVSTP